MPSGNQIDLSARACVGYASGINKKKTLNAGPHDGNWCHARHLLGDVGEEGLASVSGSRTPITPNRGRKGNRKFLNG